MRHLQPRPRRTGGSGIGLWQRWVLNIGAVLGSVCLLFAAMTLVFGLKPLIFASGSMGPAIPTGSLALAVAMPAAQVQPGQVVSVVNESGTRVTHRAVSAVPGEGLILKGDANPTADLQPYTVDSVDCVLFSVPLLGFVVGWFSQPWLFFLGGLLCAYLIYVAFIRRDSEAGTDERRRHRGRAGAGRHAETDSESRRGALLGMSAMVAAIGIAVPLGGAVKVESTQAAFQSQASATAGPVTAATLQPVPGQLACRTTGGVLGALTSAQLSWTPTTLPTGARYALRLQTSGTSYAYTDLPPGTTQASYGPGLALLGLVTEGGNQTLAVQLLVVRTSDGKTVDPTGVNISWRTPDATSPARTIVYHPGVLLARYFSCS
ncbi:hypothetical protein ACT3TS_12235 [Specibacter sp. AOP5-B1-6]|uniref:hypothetical protein n=1 Tax=Specibacter sp. AOP5-B1-6 TaxID=3457653 RepID=UPI00402B6754